MITNKTKGTVAGLAYGIALSVVVVVVVGALIDTLHSGKCVEPDTIPHEKMASTQASLDYQEAVVINEQAARVDKQFNKLSPREKVRGDAETK